MKAPATPTTIFAKQPKPRPATTRPARAPAIRPTMIQAIRPPGSGRRPTSTVRNIATLSFPRPAGFNLGAEVGLGPDQRIDVAEALVTALEECAGRNLDQLLQMAVESLA